MNPNFVNRCKNFVKQQTAAKNVLITYLRDDNYQPYGVVVATNLPERNHIQIGVALCNTKKDSFNKYVGTYIAMQRAVTNTPLPSSINGPEMFRRVCEMRDRANRYWKRELVNA